MQRTNCTPDIEAIEGSKHEDTFFFLRNSVGMVGTSSNGQFNFNYLKTATKLIMINNKY